MQLRQRLHKVNDESESKHTADRRSLYYSHSRRHRHDWCSCGLTGRWFSNNVDDGREIGDTVEDETNDIGDEVDDTQDEVDDTTDDIEHGVDAHRTKLSIPPTIFKTAPRMRRTGLLTLRTTSVTKQMIPKMWSAILLTRLWMTPGRKPVIPMG